MGGKQKFVHTSPPGAMSTALLLVVYISPGLYLLANNHAPMEH